MININSSNQRDFMNLIGEKIRKDVNNEIRLLLLIANELYRKDRVSSYRNFCKKYLQKNSNLLNVLIYNDKKPSISVLLTVYAENGSVLFTRGGILVGFTSSSVSIQRPGGTTVDVYAENGSVTMSR